MRILMIEDEKRLAEAVRQVLASNNYSVDLAHDGEYGLDCALCGIYDIIVLDIMLPKKDGISVLKELRRQKVETPVMLLTAKGETEDKVLGLDSGADDYLSKPFQTSELLARLRALSRRRGEFRTDDVLIFEDLELNPHTLDLRVGSKAYRLTLKESQILELLILNKGITVSTDTIIEKLWGYDGEAEDSHVQVYISFLRKKLSSLNACARIQTIRGLGYTLLGGKEARLCSENCATN
jgi:DNA-binding response OmpR family regulator